MRRLRVAFFGVAKLLLCRCCVALFALFRVVVDAIASKVSFGGIAWITLFYRFPGVQRELLHFVLGCCYVLHS